MKMHDHWEQYGPTGSQESGERTDMAETNQAVNAEAPGLTTISDEYRLMSSEQLLFSELSGIPVLTEAQRQVYIARAQQGDHDARNILRESCLALVVEIAKRYLGRKLSLIELVSIGSRAIDRAIDGFDCSSGNAFSTYAVPFISGEISRCIVEFSNRVHIPVVTLTDINRLRRMMHALQDRLGMEPSVEQLASEMGKSTRRVRELLVAARINTMIDIDAPLAHSEDGDAVRVRDIIPDSDTVEKAVLRAENAGVIRSLLDSLTLEEQLIVGYYFGFDGGSGRTDLEISALLHIPRSTVSWKRSKAINTMREEAERRGYQLQDFLGD